MQQRSRRPYSCYVLTAIEIVKKHIDENPFLFKRTADLLSHIDTPNRNILERAFRELHGMGIKQYMVTKRLEQSKKFLLSGMDLKIVASTCFYSNHNSYSRAFKAAFKITPTDWLNEQPDI